METHNNEQLNIDTLDDLRDYKEIIDRSNVLKVPQRITSDQLKDQNTKISKFLINEEDSEEGEETDKVKDQEKEVSGIYSLPGDIKVLIKQHHLLLVEFRAGNKS